MKLCLLLSFLTIVLSVLPCTDGEAMHDHEVSKLEATQDHEQESCDDLCSPFCVCACCGVNVAPLKVPIGIPEPTVLGSIHLFQSTYRFLYCNQFLEASWQPPEVS